MEKETKSNKGHEKKPKVTIDLKESTDFKHSRQFPMDWPKWGRRFFLVALIIFFFVILSTVREILLPFILAVVIAYILAPVVDWISAKKIKKFSIPRWVAVIMIYIVLGVIISSFSVIAVPRFATEFSKLAEDAPGFFRKASNEWIPQFNEQLQLFINDITQPEKDLSKTPGKEPQKLVEPQEMGEQLEPSDETPSALEVEPSDIDEISEQENNHDPIIAQVDEETSKNNLLKDLENYSIEVESYSENKYHLRLTPSKRVFSKEGENGLDLNATVKQYMDELLSSGEQLIKQSISLGQSLVSIIVGSLMTLVLTLMLAAFMLVDTPGLMKAFRGIVPPMYREEYDDILKGIDRGLGGVIRGQLMICLVNGTLTGLGLVILGVKYAFILALIATVFSLIPIFGTILSSIPSVGIALTQSFGLGLAVLVWIIIIHLIEANLLNPKIIGTSAKIHPVMVVFALVAGEYAYGLFGALLAVAAFSIFQTLFLYFKSKAYGEEVED